MSSSSVSTTASRSFSRCSATRSAIESGIGCGPASRPPSGSRYAHMWRRSTIPVSSCSAPIGSWMATQRSESCWRAASSTRKKSARSRSSMLTKRTRESSSSSARFQTRLVLTSTPITPLSTTTTPSTTRSAAYVSAWKPASPGVSTRLILRSFHPRWQSEPESDIPRFCSCSSQSETVVPCSTVPSRFVCPDSNNSASTREVFPTPRWPATATLRIFVGSVAGIGVVSSSVASSRIVSPPFAAERRLEGGGRAHRRDVGLEPENRLRVELGDPRFGDPEHLADLPERQLLVVVERDDELLALREPRDRVGERLLLLGHRERALRVRGALVLDRVDERHLVAATRARDGPQLVERRDRGAGDLAEALLELLLADPELLGDLLVGRRSAEPGLELADRALDVARAGANGARDPVHGAQLVDDLALDASHGIRLELHVARRVVALDRPDQPEQAVRDEVALVDVGGEARAEAARDVLHERRVREDEAIADLLVARAPEVQPELLGLVGPRRHARENTAFSGELLSRSAPAAPERARREGREPGRHGGGGDTDEQTAAAVPTCECVDGDRRQRGREDREQRPQRVRLHGSSVLPLFGRQRLLALALVLAVPLLLLRSPELLFVRLVLVAVRLVHELSHAPGLPGPRVEKRTGTLAHRHRGVAQLVERRSPKP